MSSGAVVVPWILIPYWLTERIEFLHETSYYILPPKLDITLQWGPEEDDKVFIIFALTFGRPRYYDTMEEVYSDDVGWWHRGIGMKLHWDPAVESIIGICYPHVTPATRDRPFEIRLYNYLDRPIIMDISIWFYETTREVYEGIRRACDNLVRLWEAGRWS